MDNLQVNKSSTLKTDIKRRIISKMPHKLNDVRELLIKLLMTRTSLMPVDDRKFMVTIYFILNAIDVIDHFKERHEKWEELEGFFRQMECEELD